MDSEQLNQIDKLAQLAEKYGLALVLLLILLAVLLIIVRMIIKGDLVPREMLEKVEEDRDRLQAILDKEREGFMLPLLEVVKNMKKDDPEHRGG
ncbi:hypothetical protein J31TS4_19060 [Paenibacillus sp. J31TS4]|uniref:hypothetical protein n=1 Tax=Paenibacillus sp. J31TS4 TaxID=2807195 RepID=UPI001B0D6ABB|nr:hypothetical protein [Paenibacillus sp. J31TS4]GIP38626.1 hypothetical protein J31TS4_19060 [Paenibacillus sp. J31TS4]